jgi:predicted GIY-YIG superfamily endonuclease
MYYVYMLIRSDGQKYIGSTAKSRFRKRMNEHKVKKMKVGSSPTKF